MDPVVYGRIEERIANLVDKLDNRPTEAGLLADALSRFETLLADAFHPDRIAAAASTARGSDGTRESLAQIHSELAALQDDLRSSARRDRELLAAISDAVERLASRDPVPAPAGEAPAADVAPLAPADEDADAATWREIERTLAENIGQRPRRAAEALEAAFADVDGGARLFGRRPAEAAAAASVGEVVSAAPAPVVAPATPAVAEAPAVEPVVAVATPTADADDALDLNAPLEPGSGKPARLTAKAAVVAAKSSDAPRSEPSKADFIAAARRAAQAAGADLPVSAGRRAAAPAVVLAGDEAKAAAKGRFALKLPAFASANRRQLLVATLAVGVALVGTRMIVTNFLQGAPEPEMAGTVAPVEVQPEASLAPAEPPPAQVATTTETPLPSVPDDRATASRPVPDEAPRDVAAAEPAASEPATPPPAAETAPPASGVASLPPGPAGELGRAATDAPSAAADGKSATETAPAAEQQVAALPPEATAPEAPAPVTATDLPPLPDAIGPLALREAAKAGNPVAQFEVAARLTEGRGVPQNLGDAVKWYEKAAANGLAPAQYRLGSLYEKGQGVPRDTKVAADWYSKAADAGNAKAMHNLAVLYAEGGVGQPNYDTAATWFQKAADLGVRDSQYNLGILYARGLGVPRDLTASYKWFAIAAAAGDSDSAKKRDDVAQVLDKDALARAASRWRPGRRARPRPAPTRWRPTIRPGLRPARARPPWSAPAT